MGGLHLLALVELAAGDPRAAAKSGTTALEARGDAAEDASWLRATVALAELRRGNRRAAETLTARALADLAGARHRPAFDVAQVRMTRAELRIAGGDLAAAREDAEAALERLGPAARTPRARALCLLARATEDAKLAREAERILAAIDPEHPMLAEVRAMIPA